MSFIAEHWDTILKVIGGASALAAIFAKLTKNKTDDKIVALVQKGLDFFAVNPLRAAKEAGDKAVADKPAEGLSSITGSPRDID